MLGDDGPLGDGIRRLGGQRQVLGAVLGLGRVVGRDDEAVVLRGAVDADAGGVLAVPVGYWGAGGGVAARS